MKKLVILLIVCAVLGIVMTRDPGTPKDDANSPAATAVADPALAALPASADVTPAPPVVQPSLAADPEPEPKVEPAVQPVTQPEPKVQPAVEVAEPKPEPVARPVSTGIAVAPVLEEARALIAAGNTVKARTMLSEVYLQVRGADAQAIRKVLDPICQELIFNPRNTDIAKVYTVEPGDNLVAIGRKLKVPWRLILLLNKMTEKDARSMRVGRQLKVLTGKPSVAVWKGEFRMALLMEGVYVKEYPIGTGRNNKTPAGTFVVNNMMIHAPWTAPDGKIYQYGEEGYQLGERWIAFEDQPGASGLGIHGTHDESSIGTMCSNGCLRMKNADVMELYEFLRNGTKVTIME